MRKVILDFLTRVLWPHLKALLVWLANEITQHVWRRFEAWFKDWVRRHRAAGEEARDAASAKVNDAEQRAERAPEPAEKRYWQGQAQGWRDATRHFELLWRDSEARRQELDEELERLRQQVVGEASAAAETLTPDVVVDRGSRDVIRIPTGENPLQFPV